MRTDLSSFDMCQPVIKLFGTTVHHSYVRCVLSGLVVHCFRHFRFVCAPLACSYRTCSLASSLKRLIASRPWRGLAGCTTATQFMAMEAYVSLNDWSDTEPHGPGTNHGVSQPTQQLI